ncbi:MAG TPA: PAS domain S-box protein, partial [Syntrophobacteraceae bacterium]|nr:PAS domain S-box protein [Syntrophobacteraceae bacterium]
MRALTRWMLAALTVVLLAMLLGGGWFYRVQKGIMRQAIETDLAAVVRLKAGQIAAWRQERLEHAALLRENPLFIQNVASFVVDPREETAAELRAHFFSIAKNLNYVDVLLLGSDGRVRLSLRGQTDLDGADASAVAAALREGKPALSDLHEVAQNQAPHISAVGPLFTGDRRVQGSLGAVILVSDASRFLFPLIESWPTPAKTAETVLVRREDDEALFLNNLRYKKDAALKLRIPMSRTEVPAVMAVKGQQGVFEGKDYRGVEVLSVILPIPDSPWFMVAKIDSAEAFGEWRSRAVLILGLLAGLAGLSVVLGLIVLQREEKERNRKLYRAEAELRACAERHSVILKSIGDALIAADAVGRVELLNAAAEALTGWSDAEARGRPLEEIFRIVNEQTRASVENPVARVLREGVIVGIANHSLLIARDGVERAVAHRAAPIRADDGTLTGVILVFRDQTAERQAQRLTQMRADLIEYAAAHTLDEFLRKVLDEIGAFVGSPIGFYHFLESDQNTLCLQQWSTRTLNEFCKAEGKGRRYSIDEAGVWVDCVRERKPVIHNDYSSQEHKKAMPEGRAGAVRELAVPVMRQGRVVAVLGVGNKAADYTEKDAEAVAWLADVMWETVERKRAVEDGRQREEISSAIVDRATEGIVVIDYQTLRFVEFNDAACNGLGYSREEFARLTLFDIQGILSREDLPEHFRKVVGAGRANFENKQRRKDGSLRDVLVSSQVLGFGDDKYLVALWLDITERKRMEEALRKSEQRFRTILQTANEGFWLIDNENATTDVNPKMCDILGRKQEEILGRKIFDFVDDENRVIFEQQIKLRAQGLTSVYEIALSRPDGLHLSCRFSVTPLFDGSGSRVGAFAMVTDITERKRTEMEQALTIDFLRLVNESRNREEMVRSASAFFHQRSGCDAVGIRLKEGDDYPYYETRGSPAEFVLAENSLCAIDDMGEVIRDTAGYPILECMCGNIIYGRFDPSKPFFTNNGSFWTNCTTELLATSTEEDLQARTRNRCNGDGYESVALIPLSSGDDRLGLLQLNDRRKDRFSPEDIALWERLARYLAVTLAKINAQDLLRESEHKFAVAFKNAPVMACITAVEDGTCL